MLLLEGSCHCRAVRFRVESSHPVPFNRCYCSICRKTAGAGGFAINLAGDAKTLVIEGENFVKKFHAKIRNGDTEKDSQAFRHFCSECGTALWLWDPRWPELVHPHAGAIDTELPPAPEHAHMMTASRPAWVPVDAKPGDTQFDGYPKESIAAWHERHGLVK